MRGLSFLCLILVGLGCGDDDDVPEADGADVDGGGGDGGGDASIGPRITNDVTLFQGIGGAGADGATDVAVGADGSVFLTGTFSGTVDLGLGPETSAGGGDAYVVKLQPSGAVSWVQTFGGVGEDAGLGVAVSGSNVYLTGTFSNTVSTAAGAITSQGSTDAFLFQLDDLNGGVPLWVQSAGGVEADAGVGVGVDLAGNVYLTGTFSNFATFGPFGAGSAGLTDVFVTQAIPGDGSFQFLTTFGDLMAEDVGAITFSSADAGLVYLTGTFSGTVDFGSGAITSTAGSRDVYVLQLDIGGGFLNVRTYGDASDDGGVAIATNDLGDVFLTGTFSSSVDFADLTAGALLSEGLSDVFVAQYFSGIGLFATWSGSFGGTGADVVTDLAVTGAGDVFLTGTFSNQLLFGTLDALGGDDVFVARVAAQGALQWVRGAGGFDDDRPGGVAPVGNDVVVVGTFTTDITFDDTVIASQGDSDGFVLRFSAGGSHRMSVAEGGADAQAATAVAAGRDVFAVTGIFQNQARIGATPLSSDAMRDGFMAVYDYDGVPRFAHPLGGQSEAVVDPTSVALDDDLGLVLVGGNFSGMVQLDPLGSAVDSGGRTAGFLVKRAVDAPGMIHWARTLASTGDLFIADVAFHPTRTDEIIVTGSFSGTITFDDEMLDTSPSTETNIFIVRLNLDGDPIMGVQTAVQFGESGADRAEAMAISPQGILYLTGHFTDFIAFAGVGGPGQLSNMGQTAYALSWEFESQFHWATMLLDEAGFPRGASGVAIAADSNSDIYVATARDLFAYTATGGVRWETASFNDIQATNVEIADVAGDGHGNAVLVGRYDGQLRVTGLPPLDPGTGPNMFVVKSAGDQSILPQWGFAFPSGAPFGLAIDPLDRALIGGKLDANADWGGDPLVFDGGDAFLLHLRP